MHGRQGYCRWNSFSLNRGTRNICSPVWILFWLALLLWLHKSDCIFNKICLYLRVIGISCEFQDNFQPEKSKGSKLSQWSACCCCCPSSHEWSRSAWLPEIGHRSIPLCAVGYHKYTLNSLFLYLPRVWNGTRTRQARGGLKDGEVTPGWRCCC